MKKISLISMLVLLALLATASLASASASRTVYRTALSEAPGAESQAHGNAVFQFADDGSQVKYKLVVNGLEDTFMAHIHVATEPGANGPIVLWLYPAAPPSQLIPGVFNGLLGSHTATAADLTGANGVDTLEALRSAIEEGRAYVNVHTAAYPGGEIRGTIH